MWCPLFIFLFATRAKMMFALLGVRFSSNTDSSANCANLRLYFLIHFFKNSFASSIVSIPAKAKSAANRLCTVPFKRSIRPFA